MTVKADGSYSYRSVLKGYKQKKYGLFHIYEVCLKP
jgi:hypothetical protein